ncbi:hypothetical protein FSPOR_11471 [Fusarium sporotrichioides]|uniref:Uncharacterized protein n=1 Tax=Fusarium sporotrichioides TaxID=5514 RepID=A0A395RGM9_FUSSP|nr:hypothetical protein FSPOR_11471 [Fusarium sporotrichioides]
MSPTPPRSASRSQPWPSPKPIQSTSARHIFAQPVAYLLDESLQSTSSPRIDVNMRRFRKLSYQSRHNHDDHEKLRIEGLPAEGLGRKQSIRKCGRPESFSPSAQSNSPVTVAPCNSNFCCEAPPYRTGFERPKFTHRCCHENLRGNAIKSTYPLQQYFDFSVIIMHDTPTPKNAMYEPAKFPLAHINSGQFDSQDKLVSKNDVMPSHNEHMDSQYSILQRLQELGITLCDDLQASEAKVDRSEN